MLETMLLVEHHVICHADPRWQSLDDVCFRSKNLYNAANYLLRQEFIFNHHYIPYPTLAKRMQHDPDFCSLPRKVSQQVLIQLDHDWQAFFAAHAEWQVHPEKFTGRPRLPKYKHKTAGRNVLVYTIQALSQPALQKGVIAASQLPVRVQTHQTQIHQVRIVPHRTHYMVEVVYVTPIQPAQVNPEWVASVDLGLNNLAALTSNKPGFVPLLVNGRPLKALNQQYNKQRAHLQSLLGKDRYTSPRLEALTDQRNRQVKHYLHVASRRIIDMLVEEGIGRVVIGKNDGWKQGIDLGSRTNQNFVFVPHTQFIEMLTYKAQLVGIEVIITEESYTSKCSFLDLEPIGKQEVYVGKRVKRGLFRASDGRCINADVNGAYNILRKVIPDAWTGKGIGGAVVHPVRSTLTK